MMFWLVVGYLFLFIFRPYEYMPILGTFRIERVYMLCLMTAAFFNAEKKFIPHRVNGLVFGFVGVLVLSGLFAMYPDIAYDQVYEYVKLLIFYLIIISAIRNPEELKKFIIAYIAIMFLYVGKSCWEYFVNGRYSWQQGMARMVGIDATYGDSNSFSASIAYSLPFLWALFRYRLESVWLRRLLWAYTAIVPVAIINSGSRAGMVCVLFFLFLVFLSTSRKMVGLVTISLALAVTWNFMPEKLQKRFESIFVKGEDAAADNSAQGRKEGLLQGIRTFNKYPVLGIGPGNFKYSWEGIPDTERHNPHNLYGQVLGELGGLGTIIFFSMVWCIYRTHKKIIGYIRKLLSDDEAIPDTRQRELLLMQYVAVASTQAILMLLFNGNFGHNLYRYNWLWIGALAVLASHFLQRFSDEQSETA